jgi:hypothetical protein
MTARGRSEARTGRHLHWAFLVVLTISLQPSAGATQALLDDHLIIPGASIGSADLAPADQGALVRALGEPNATEQRGDHEYYRYGAGDDPNELVVDFDLAADAPFEISTTSPAYRTQEGLGVGSSEMTVITKLGRPLCEGHDARGNGLLVYDSIWFLTLRGNVTRVAIRNRIRPGDVQSGPVHC